MSGTAMSCAATGFDGRLVERAHAKINLFLHVTGRRPDGYHLLDSLAVFAGAHDVLSATPAPELGLSVSGRFGATLRQEDASSNLVVRAAGLLRGAGSLEPGAGAAFLLEKNLPVASGIGGGSADAAAALRLLCRLWPDRAPEPARLQALAVTLGADVPVCLSERPARMGGVGDLLSAAPFLPEYGLLLVNCGEAVSTPAVFRARAAELRAPADLPAGWPDASAMAADLGRLHNDLQPAAISLCPAIAEVLEAIKRQRGCLLARMSGSGATCFGLFPQAAAAAAAANALARPDWWVWGGAPCRPGPDLRADKRFMSSGPAIL